ncbi:MULTISPECIES: hypothetical protein [unclassified Streptomyces]|uniref:hypothetical protein n=1 Tax=unclassified Streptomyces TaxID=2593676 RepID=UPI0035E0C27B
MKLTLDGDWTATVAGEPLDIAPRFDFRDFRVRIATYADVEERDQFQVPPPLPLVACSPHAWIWSPRR